MMKLRHLDTLHPYQKAGDDEFNSSDSLLFPFLFSMETHHTEWSILHLGSGQEPGVRNSSELNLSDVCLLAD